MQKLLLIVLFCSCFACQSRTQQTEPEPTMSPNAERFYEKHPEYRVAGLETRRFKLEDIEPVIKALPAPFTVKLAGKSFQNRNIYHVSIGTGPVKVLMWSQMHGDEPTATMALMDLFQFLQKKDEFDSLRQVLLSKLTLHFIPMLNPDGANRFTRRNMQGIDINRDAMRLQTPEGRILKRIRDETKADWGFNLHDQNIYLGAGVSPYPASISVLAPAYNYTKDINETRGDAMRLIGVMNQLLQKHIPKQVGRYDDAFEPRAFGDNIQKWGTSTILIESGGLKGDPENQMLRRLNFSIFLTALEAIAMEKYKEWNYTAYEGLPENQPGGFHDLVVRKVQVMRNDKWYKVDLAFRREEVNYDNSRKFFYRANIAEMGDLMNTNGYDEIELEGYQAVPGSIKPGVIGWEEASKLDHLALLRQGITDVQVSTWPESLELSKLGVLLIRPRPNPANPGSSTAINLGSGGSILLQKDGKTEYAVVNGFLIKVQ
ncbi:MAG TPA: M14 family zinc carboxypeptidase [Haliscomenobacter sp.]|nr:M14 family zinc carboxypeptidase [Haliscomenobacter sp.]